MREGEGDVMSLLFTHCLSSFLLLFIFRDKLDNRTKLDRTKYMGFGST